ncbi:O-fucosyltransferase 30 isoform X2 [Punica granatum]|uniref:Uncharacterized protein n=2 Tax=Punica granatum TaxID=22663 RepID=A0A2I0IC33_PUNGR|nr:O-fucosyltransferase 30 isoform X2 [Punica granatum]PKI41542.1 hypothetical protein CRG98_038053 [Punica granatum]
MNSAPRKIAEEEGEEESMNSLIELSGRAQRPPWPRRKPPSRSLLLFPSLLLLTLLFFLCYYSFVSKSALTVLRDPLPPPGLRCNPEILSSGERYLWYAPHSGFSNQLSELRNAALMAGILNRTLVVPPVLDHHAVALGSCPKFRVMGPTQIRAAVWDHTVELLRSGRLKQCGYFLSGVDGNVDNCLYTIEEDCRSTVWIYQREDEDGKLDVFQPDEQLKKKKNISYIRRRRDVYKTLGPGTEADSAAVLAFGSLFTSPYKGSQLLIDITGAPREPKIQSLIDEIVFLPFVPEIVSAGKEFAQKTINTQYLCAQLRLLDGQFKNHWKSTFLGLKQTIGSLRQKVPLPIHIFVMTDLPKSNWTGNYLGELAQDFSSYKLHFLKEEDELVARTAKELSVAGHSLRIGKIPRGFDRVDKLRKSCSPKELSDVLLYIEEIVCSCASLGFVGTAGSTIAESIELMRKYDSCSLNSHLGRKLEV